MRRALVALVACGAPVAPIANQHHEPTVAEIMDGALAALGGRARLAQARTIHTVEAVTEKDESHAIETWVVRPDRVRQDYSTMGHTQTTVADGDGGWASSDGYPMPLVGSMHDDLLRASLAPLASDWRTAYPHVTLVGRTRFADQPAFAVAYGDASTHYFATTTLRELGFDDGTRVTVIRTFELDAPIDGELFAQPAPRLDPP